MFSRRRTNSTSSAAGERNQGQAFSHSPATAAVPGHNNNDRMAIPDNMTAGKNGDKGSADGKRKSFMGIHFGGHKDKEKTGKEKGDQGPPAVVQYRQSMDQQRRPPGGGGAGRDSFSMGRASMSGPPRPQYSSSQGQRPASPARAGSGSGAGRIVSQPNPSSYDNQRRPTGDDGNGGNGMNRTFQMQEQGRGRASGGFTSPPPSGLMLSTNQAPGGSFHSSSPGKGSFTLSRPGSVGSAIQQPDNGRGTVVGDPENGPQQHGGGKEFPRSQSQSQHLQGQLAAPGVNGTGTGPQQGGSFAVSGRPLTTGSGERYNNDPVAAPLQTGQAARPLGNLPSKTGIPSQQSAQTGGTITSSSSGNAVRAPGSPRQGNGNAALANVLRSYTDLNASQAGKLYASSPPELEMIFARQTNGAQPKQGPPGSISNDWDKVWLQLTGTSLSIWSMKETAEAAKRGERIPPTYHNITDSTIELLNPLPPPPHRGNSKPYPFCFSLNTAGSNRILLSCPSEYDRTLFVSALRLSAWEKSRLEEIYTGHLLRTFVSGGRAPVVAGNANPNWNEPDASLSKGTMEGWVRVRVMGTIEWKRLWLVLRAPVSAAGSNNQDAATASGEKKRKGLFSFASHDKHPAAADHGAGVAGVASTRPPGMEDGVAGASAVFYREAPVRGKGNKNVVPPEPLLQITHVTQAYAVYPEQIDVIPMSNLLKVTGRISGDLVVVEGRPRLNGWAMIMCEKQDQDTPANGASHPVVVDMLRWATGFHDAFGLYGRPKNYSWDKGDPGSLFFAYQDQGPNRLFLDTTQASTIDPNLDNVAHARQMYANMVTQRLIDDLQGSRTTTPSQYSNTSRSTNQPPVAAASSSSLYLAQHSPEQQASPVRNRSREQVDELSSDDEEGQYEEHLSDSAYHGPGQQMASGEMLHNNDDSTPTMHPLRADTLTPITEKSDVASRKTSINTMNTLSTLDRARLGGSQSSSRGLVQQGSGSGSSHLGRNPSTGTRLIEPMVIEEVMTSSPATSAQPQLPSDETLNVVSENTVTPRNSNFDPRDMVYQHEAHAPTSAAETRGLTDMPATAQQPIEVVAPKPQKPSDAFDEATVLQDNAYLLDQIALVASPEKGRATISPRPPGKSVDSLDSTSPSGDPEKSARSLLGRKPSGARAMPAKRQASGASQVPSLEPVYDDQRPVTPPASSPVTMPQQPAHMANHNGIAPSPSLNADAMAAMTFLDGAASPRKTRDPSPLAVKRQPDEQDQGDQKAAYRSSFAPSRAAQDRRVRAQEAEKHRDDVMTKPGVRRAPIHRKKADWSASSDDEDSEEEDENSESDSEAEQEKRSTAPPTRPSSVTGPRNEIPQAASQMSLGRGGNGRPLPNPDDSRRVSRNLPPIPGTQRALSAAYPEFRTQPLALPDNQRSASWTHQDAPVMTSTMAAQNSPLSSAYNSGDEARLAAPAYRPPPRKNMWNSDLDAPHVGIEPNEPSQKFVQLEPGNAQMTKAFTPHGLLQAGLQDKEDRSAKKQEENAKETGSSLVNVPNKPPPPQAGLLGAITAHERDRKAPGGIGAALTERERDRRLAEERQRQIDDLQTLQRQTMFGQASSPGFEYSRPMSAYGGSTVGMGYPMQMNNPSMMWGMGNPYAAQAMMAANMAYQNSIMMAMSAAGSQYGGGTPGGGGAGGDHRATSPMLPPPPPHMMMSPPPPPMMSPGIGMGYPGFNSPMMPPWGGMMMPPAPPTLHMPPTSNANGRNSGDGAGGGGQGTGGR